MRHEGDMTEAEMLDAVRPRYEAEGFRFVVRPGDEILPSFLRGQRPDAIAFKAPGGTIIEVKKRGPYASTVGRSSLAERVAAEKDWTLSVLYWRGRPGEIGTLPPPSRREMDDLLLEIEAHAVAGRNRAAVLSSWILFEAMSRFLDKLEEDKSGGTAMSPVQAVQRIASSGYIDEDLFTTLSHAAVLRTHLVHGDLGLVPTSSDVSLLVDTLKRIRDEIYRDAGI